MDKQEKSTVLGITRIILDAIASLVSSILLKSLGAAILSLYSYNSAVYSSLYAIDYMVFMANEDMLVNEDPSSFLARASDPGSNLTARYMHASALARNLTRLENVECMEAYATTFQTSHGSLILVTNDTNYSNLDYSYINSHAVYSPPVYPCVDDPFGWICGDGNLQACYGSTTSANTVCTLQSVDPTNWKPWGSKIEYCLSENVESRCRVQFVPPLAYIVIVFNIAKAGILLYAYLSIKENPLMTIGDAVSSFLNRQDETTKDLCLMAKEDIHLWEKNWRQPPRAPHPKHLNTKPNRWSKTVSTKRWMVVLSLYCLILLACIILFIFSLISPGGPTSRLMALGFGATNPMTLIAWSLPNQGVDGLVQNVLVANLPQPILSSIYYTYNGIFTCFMLGVEWNGFARVRKGLRVSHAPSGAQRSSYTLQLPKRVALPLMTLSGILHWLCSQSIFLVSLDFDQSRLPPDSAAISNGVTEFLTCGYSPSAILAAILAGIFMLVALIALGRVQFKSKEMPVASSCSAAISASCHPGNAGINENHEVKPYSTSIVRTESESLLSASAPFQDPVRNMSSTTSFMSDYASERYNYVPYGVAKANYDNDPTITAYMPVNWGRIGDEIPMNESHWAKSANTAYSDLLFGHCAFSSGEVHKPRAGILYAGVPETAGKKDE
jgi:hypothetical protein